ncbi:MAG: hypothetical protein MUF00_11985 [Gemmatimonadaceae bacterium]|nr:hypothetical protein [Gemmatimonadaceae bacterium]
MTTTLMRIRLAALLVIVTVSAAQVLRAQPPATAAIDARLAKAPKEKGATRTATTAARAQKGGQSVAFGAAAGIAASTTSSSAASRAAGTRAATVPPPVRAAQQKKRPG